MTEYIIREYRPGDRAALTALWRQVFGDPEAVVAAEREKAQKARDLISQLEQSEAAMRKLV